MTKKALVTGSATRAGQVASALASAGFEVLSAQGPDQLGDLLGQLEQRSLDVYVQLPVEVEADATTVTAQLSALLQQGIVARFRSAEAVLPYLGADARVVLVPGNLPPSLSAPDDHEARLSLLRVLAHALRADRAPDRLSVTIASAQHSADELALVAGGTPVPHPPLPDYAQMWPDMAYDEWRLAVLGQERLEG